ncbi:DUF6268 family outer membrane beta-barrel protein [Aquimarina mytili]|uniref:Outer membrane protein beta-barrel domain-containing protein n=1 Tax=Aquimarina mytili TaxID=874423 RepID=A0A937D6X5_9FLAO|nr:DUF6268 family outer membrane beta-barrel protein [Aquimarina mytili]MBL0684909.1 hypothetical protein [Aquimarina mytili]
MKNNYIVLIGILLQTLCSVSAQDTDLARIEYAYIPQANSENVYSRFRISANYPIKMNKDGTYLVIATQYRYNSLQIGDELIFDEGGDLNAFQTLGLELGYTFKMKNNWRFGTKIGSQISSNFEASGIESDDFRYSVSLYFVKSYKNKNAPKTSRLIMGLRYATPASINFPLPIINYFKRFHPSWSYSVGTPKTSIKYFFNEKNTLQAFVGLDRFYGNLQNNRAFIDENGEVKVAENASMLNIMGALGYEYYFTEHLLFYTYAGYTLSNEIRLRDANQENVYTINEKNTFYFRSGIKLKI